MPPKAKPHQGRWRGGTLRTDGTTRSLLGCQCHSRTQHHRSRPHHSNQAGINEGAAAQEKSRKSPKFAARWRCDRRNPHKPATHSARHGFPDCEPGRLGMVTGLCHFVSRSSACAVEHRRPSIRVDARGEHRRRRLEANRIRMRVLDVEQPGQSLLPRLRLQRSRP